MVNSVVDSCVQRRLLALSLSIGRCSVSFLRLINVPFLLPLLLPVLPALASPLPPAYSYNLKSTFPGHKQRSTQSIRLPKHQPKTPVGPAEAIAAASRPLRSVDGGNVAETRLRELLSRYRAQGRPDKEERVWGERLTEYNRVRAAVIKSKDAGREWTAHSLAQKVQLTPFALVRVVRDGRAAEEWLTWASQHAASYVVQQYMGRGTPSVRRWLPNEELLHATFVGVRRALVRYNATRGAKFTTYAQRLMEQEAYNVIQGAQPIQFRTKRQERLVPKLRSYEYQDVLKQEGALAVGKRLNLTLDELEPMLEVAKGRYTTFDQLNTRLERAYAEPVGPYDGFEAAGGIHVDDRDVGVEVRARHFMESVNERLRKHLTQVERDMIRLMYGFDDYVVKSLDEVAKLTRIPRHQAEEILVSGIDKLRDSPDLLQEITDFAGVVRHRDSITPKSALPVGKY
ncbi:unnamed protein product [Vitrella brassicaformis CCMP3155]|uniref:RNA polymerase sigma-70 region 2 domain-containing protein n=1 Tax=Vitrella brassicaformis (strain CCMP3155) TaxID=1169540 RepID=A0A0G4EWB6_VITBC|nr:unnamed protein product [Vitrella brassicaformis CCMP3155]|eukprot:CEM02543.1 unnamed protein product [Vitrella brassicaformis CCMP3155]